MIAGTLRSVYTAGPRVEQAFLDGIARLDDPTEPMAETYRRIRALADELGVPRPSYERVRQHLRLERRRQAGRASARELALELAFNSRRADEVVVDLVQLLE